VEQGAFTLFRDIRIKHTRNVSPSAQGLYEKGSWGVKNETDGSITVYTVGQKVVQETVDAYRQASRVAKLNDVELKAAGFMELDTQPSGRFYRV
jgi:beta-fructofuranosidase